MKTNASISTIVKAVQNVSNEKYNGNVVFMNKPKDLTKYVRRFTLRTKDVNGPGSMITKAGQRQPKAKWEVQQDVMDEILRLNPDPSIYVDTIYGRKFSTGQIVPETVSIDSKSELEPVLAEVIEESDTSANSSTGKRKYTKKLTSVEKPKTIRDKGKLLNALKYVLKHPELLD